MPKQAAALFRSHRRWTAEDARSALAALDRSGLSIREFAVREGIDPQRLYWWRRRFASSPCEAITLAFVELTPTNALSAVAEVLLRSGRVLRVPVAIESTALRRLVDALEEDGAC